MNAIIDPHPSKQNLKQQLLWADEEITKLREARANQERRIAASVARELQLIKEADRLKSELAAEGSLVARFRRAYPAATRAIAVAIAAEKPTCGARPAASYDYPSAGSTRRFAPLVDEGYDDLVRGVERECRGYAIDFDAPARRKGDD